MTGGGIGQDRRWRMGRKRRGGGEEKDGTRGGG